MPFACKIRVLRVVERSQVGARATIEEETP
jgi:hypothetical protein